MKSLEIPAEKTRLIEVISFVLDYAKNLGFEKKELFQLKLCTEEIFVNVASYAYGADTGMITIVADGCRLSTAAYPLIRWLSPIPPKNVPCRKRKGEDWGSFSPRSSWTRLATRIRTGKTS